MENLGVVLVVVALFVAWKSIIRVPEHQRLVIFRLGRKLENLRGPGLVFIIPLVDRVRIVDMSELEYALSNIPSVTRDSVPVLISFRWRNMIFDSEKFAGGLGTRERDNARESVDIIFKLIAEINSQELADKVQYLNRMLRFHFDEISRPFGVMVTNVAITNLVVDDRLEKIYEAKVSVGTVGESQSLISDTGTIFLDGKLWDAISQSPIAPNTKVRVRRVILEVEEVEPST